MTQSTPEKSCPSKLIISALAVYVSLYCIFCVKYLLMAWSKDYSFLSILLDDYTKLVNDKSLVLVIYTILGSVLGGAIRSITSLHKYSALEKSFDVDHLWGYLFSPLLSTIIGILTFCFLQCGLLILTGTVNDNSSSLMVMLGYTASGAVGAYNWDVFIKKLKKLSEKIETPKE
ncbi:TPA: hypothetical protein QHK75_002394 [Klebsiella aerogenes]|nr:hypothetical protein [Klebsiella aerogenes]